MLVSKKVDGRSLRTTRKHGLAKTREWRIWCGIRRRCDDPKSSRYAYYGGRGITVCARWNRSFLAFMQDMGPCPSPKHEVDRKNNNLGYCKGNCRWATRKQQTRNRTDNRYLTFNGVRKLLVEWAEEYCIHREVLWKRVNTLGWDFLTAATTPARHRSPNKC